MQNLELRVVLGMVEEREAQLRRRSLAIQAHDHDHDTDEVRRRRVRRWIGRQLVRYGTRLTAEPPMRPAGAP